MKKSKIVIWGLLLVVLVVLTLFVGSGMASRKAQAEKTKLAAEQRKANVVIELGSSDVARAVVQPITQGLALSGSLKAANSAVVKAKVAGELQGLKVREGDVVKAGQLLARIDATEYVARLRQAQQQADAAKTQIDIAERNYNNNASLVNQGFISQTAVDTSLATLQGAKSSYQAALSAVAVTQKSLDDTRVIAPISGMVAVRNAQPGERVSIDARIVELVDLSRLELEASIAAGDAVGVRVGQKAVLHIEGVSQAVEATVVRVNPSVQAGSRSVLVYLQVDNAAGLRQGLFGQGVLATSVTSALAVPAAAVRFDKPQPFVQVIQFIGERQVVVHQTVVLGSRGANNDEEVMAVTGVQENAQVLRGNVGLLLEGTAVKLQVPSKPIEAANQDAAVPSAMPAATEATAKNTPLFPAAVDKK